MSLQIVDVFIAMKNYINGSLLEQKYFNELTIKNTEDIKVNIKVYTQNIDDIAKEKYELQYNNLTIITTDIFHEIDKKILYHCGTSFKDLIIRLQKV